MNMNNLMAQAQRMQKDMERKQKEIYESEFVGSSELVEITIKGDKRIQSIKFKNMKNFDIEDIDILEDMIKIAMNDAIDKVEKEIESKMGMYAKSLGGLM